MTYKHYNAAVDKLPEGIETATERALFLDACYRADSKGILRMSQTELMQETLWSLATIKRVFVRLEEAGLLLRLAHGRYQVHIDISETISSRKVQAEPIQARDNSDGEEQEYRLVLAHLNTYLKQHGQDITARRVMFAPNTEPKWLKEALEFRLLEFDKVVVDIETGKVLGDRYLIKREPKS